MCARVPIANVTISIAMDLAVDMFSLVSFDSNMVVYFLHCKSQTDEVFDAKLSHLSLDDFITMFI